MRIRDGKYLLSSKRDIEAAFERRRQIREAHEETIREARDMVKILLNLHRPYIAGELGVSVGGDLEDLRERLGCCDLWCAECSSRWPCRQIKPLQLLDQTLLVGFERASETTDYINARHEVLQMETRDKRGLLPVRL